eukprot:scaffold3722_cov48-Attheya_sp.AAC.4
MRALRKVRSRVRAHCFFFARWLNEKKEETRGKRDAQARRIACASMTKTTHASSCVASLRRREIEIHKIVFPYRSLTLYM